MAQQVASSLIGTNDPTFETLGQSITQLRAWLNSQGFPARYTVTISTDEVTIHSNKYTNPKIEDVYQECTLEILVLPEDSFQFPDGLDTPIKRAQHLCKTLRKTRMSPKKRLQALYELGHILTLEMDRTEQEDLRRLLGWTKRQSL